ncbi:MAG: hypothetical protein AAF432_10770 [Planctomycetota bacterium]
MARRKTSPKTWLIVGAVIGVVLVPSFINAIAPSEDLTLSAALVGGLLVIIYLLWYAFRSSHQSKVRVKNRLCLHCGFDLRSHWHNAPADQRHICPECGTREPGGAE